MLEDYNIECDQCGERSTVQYDIDSSDPCVKCPLCGAEIDMYANELFYELNMDCDNLW